MITEDYPIYVESDFIAMPFEIRDPQLQHQKTGIQLYTHSITRHIALPSKIKNLTHEEKLLSLYMNF